jgi:hypothetical protein
VVLPDGTRRTVPANSHFHAATGTERYTAHAAPESSPLTGGSGPRTRRAPLGRVCAARSGDKGGNANIGVWARDEATFSWLRDFLTTQKLVELLPEAADLTVRRFELANLYALNFVVVGLLGEGVASSTRPDPQAKGLGEYLRSRHVDIPETLLEQP